MFILFKVYLQIETTKNSKIMNAAIIGYGKMGHEIEKVLVQRGHTVSLIIDQDNIADLNAERLRGVDVAILIELLFHQLAPNLGGIV